MSYKLLLLAKTQQQIKI